MMQQQQQQSAMEEGTAFEPPTYDKTFPELPGSNSSSTPPRPFQPQNTPMRVGSSMVTHVFHVPAEELNSERNNKFGGGESMRTCQSIMKETHAHIEISESKNQSLTFLLTGKQNEVLEARRRILSTFQTQAKKEITIPKEHHRWILGKQRQRLNELEKNTATKIIIPPFESQNNIITISGTKEGIERAEHEIKVISDEQSRKAFERVNVPKIYHPFIRGAYDENLNKMINDTGARINIPPPSVQNDEITIAGEKEGVAKAKAEIEKIYSDMEKRCASVSVEVPKSQHKYVIGHRNSTISEILQLTGVSVEMPSQDSTTGTITLRGPQDKLGQALDKVYEKANSVKTASIEAPSWVHKYIIGRKGINIKKITQELPKVNIDFTVNIDKIKIEGPPEDVEKAKEQLEKVSNDLINKLTFVELKVDPRYYKHIIGKNGANVNRLKEETNVVINFFDNNGQNIIRIEGNQAGVYEAEEKLLDMVKKLENEKEKDIIIDHRFFASIIGSKGINIGKIRDKFNYVQITIPGPDDNADIVKIRGPKLDVDQCHKYLMNLVKQLDESSYSIQIPILKQFHKFVIGRGGNNLRKIRDETNTRIDFPSEVDDNEVITITGKKDNVIIARDMIQKIQNELSNTVAEEIKISPKYYNSLIGTGGKLIHSIMENCGSVTIKFPSADSNSDKVIIRGTKDDVEKAKLQLLDQIHEREVSSFTDTIRAKTEHHKIIIGRQGINIKKIRETTGARILFPYDNDDDKELITIIGKKESVDMAKKQLQDIILELDNHIEDDIIINQKYHRHFVAKRGALLNKISEDCGGGVQISFPRAGIDSDRVTIKGTRDSINMAKIKLEDIVNDLESQITIECIMPQIYHRTVMGSRGSKVQTITSNFDVQIKFPERDTTTTNNTDDIQQQQEEEINGDDNNENGINNKEPAACDIIYITGKPENAEKAKQALLDLVPITEELPVPFDLHRLIIGKSGKDVKSLMSTYDVHIYLSPAEEKLDFIKICGPPSNVKEAKEAILERVDDLEAKRKERELKSFELKFNIDPEYHPKIIGRGGAVIKKIRIDHDVQINFPRTGDTNDDEITIIGFEKNAHDAKDEIMKIVNELNELTKEEVQIDSAVHSRLIGARGKNIRRIMDTYKVEIKFPRKNDPDLDLVTIIGAEDNVLDAKDHLLNLEQEYRQDLDDRQTRTSRMGMGRGSKRDSDNSLLSGVGGGGGNNNNNGAGADNDNGFVVKGGPWEQDQPKSAPDTASVADFPTFVGHDSNQVPMAAPEGPWGRR